ncbi:MAG: RNA polymerase sigma-70 factor [Bacteroidales bacterium]|jgi:RNA polymerase sigma-70 factor (ECF subfamily)|nr:RNA polymerase sigma-70 factor [Bacteroidales bacterium]
MNDIPKTEKDFRLLFEQYYPALCGISRGYVRDKAVIEEIVNDVFVKLWNNRMQIQIHTSLKDYLFKSAQNACIDYLRTGRKHKQTTYIAEHETVCHTLADLGENPLEYVVSNEEQQQILNAIEELPERYRMTFRLVRLEGMSYEEAAQNMEISKNTVKSNLREALSVLREKLKNLAVIFLIIRLTESVYRHVTGGFPHNRRSSK